MSKNKAQDRQRELALGEKKYIMPEISTPDYLDYCDLSEEIDGVQYYRRQHYTKMAEGIVIAYGKQFTTEEVLNNLTPADIVFEFSLLEVSVLQRIDAKAEEYQANFTSST